MIFNSYSYIFLFLPVVIAVYFLINRMPLASAGRLFLIGASLFFYSWWNWKYLPLLVISILFNYAVGNLIASRNPDDATFRRKGLLIIGIAANLSLLGFFKYADFFIANINAMSGAGLGLIHIALPLAISFFTFQQIAFLVDSFRNETNAYNLTDYLIFVTFFPQLIAGPIVHHKEMMGQFADRGNRHVNWENIYAGLVIFSMGLFKKVFVADTFAVWATAGFDHAASLNCAEAWIASLSYTLQIYYDFSGYTDMAMGSARFFNIRLPENFNSPYQATNIQDFWRRWHMTLSRWLRDYLFIPLGGSRCGEVKIFRNLMITFVLGGLWHGAGWTFVIWGTMHGVGSIIHRVWSGYGMKMPKIMAWAVTFFFVNLTWVFFRAPDVQSAVNVLTAMFNVNEWIYLVSGQTTITVSALAAGMGWSKIPAWIFAFTILAGLAKNSNRLIENLRPSYQWAMLAVILLIMGMPDFQQPSEFLYFNF